MKMKQAGKIALSSLLGLTLLAGCGGSGDDAYSSDANASVPYGTEGDNEVVANLTSEPPQMASFLTNDSTSGDALRHTIEPLVTLNDKDEPIAGVAETWDHEGTKYTFHLRDSKWSNGTPVTAQDFEFAFDQLFNLSNGAPYAETWKVYFAGAENLFDVQKPSDDESGKGQDMSFADAKAAAKAELGDGFGWYAVDEKTFVVNWTSDFPYALNLLTFYNFAPVNEAFYNECGGAVGDDGDYGKEADKLLYNGPFTITSWTHEDRLVMEKNPNYWDAENIKLEKITWTMIKDTNTMLNEFENGTLDFTGMNGEQAKAYRDAGKPVQDYMDGSAWYLEFNTTVAPFNNPKVRKALTLAVDVQPFIDSILLNNSKIANTLTSPAVRGGAFNDYVAGDYGRPTDGNYDEVKAMLEEGLAEEGMTIADFKPKILGDTGDAGLKNYTYIQGQWEQNLGLASDVEQVEFKTRIARQQSQDFQVVFAGWSPDYDDPMSYLDLFVTGGGNNDGLYSNAEYDALIKSAFSEGDATKRDEMLKEVEMIIAEEMPIGPLYYRSTDYIMSGKLKGAQRSAFRKTDLRHAYTVPKE